MKLKKTLFWFMSFVFFLSLFFILFSLYQIYEENHLANNALGEWESLVQEMDEFITEEEIGLENLLNKDLDFSRSSESARDQENDNQTNLSNSSNSKQQSIEFSNQIKRGAVIGKISIPRLKRNLPIIHGTGTKELARGVGHYIGSALPGEGNNSVLSGHRETVFRGLGSIKIGDQVIIETLSGKFTYQIEARYIVELDDRTVIVPHDEAVLTLVTCYPFNYVGPAPQRYILQARLVN